jgi:Domain of unknown function (DUF5668)/Cell wall-active antibiotics response 4TMS YvqF
MEPDFENRHVDPADWDQRYWDHRRRAWERRQRIRQRVHHARLVPAVVLIAVGAIFFLNNMHIFYFREVLRYWPVILVGLGLVKVVDSVDNSGRTGGAILVVVGALFLAPSLGIWDISIGDLWPLILIGVGALLLLQRMWAPAFDWSGHAPPGTGPSPGMLNESAVFSGGRRRIVNPDFRGGEISCIFGGFDIDLRKAGIAGDSAVLVVNAIFGGCDIKVPESWDVVLEVTAVFGGCDDKTLHPDPALPGVKKLFLRGSAIFGGIDLKN